MALFKMDEKGGWNYDLYALGPGGQKIPLGCAVDQEEASYWQKTLAVLLAGTTAIVVERMAGQISQPGSGV